MTGVERVPVERLRPASWNPRTIRDPRFENLCRSIEADPDFLDRRPILANAAGIVYGGNMRLRAVQHLGWTDVPAYLDDIPDQLAKERALKDNRGWGDDVDDELGALLASLGDSGTDLSLLGFEQEDLARLLGSVPDVDFKEYDESVAEEVAWLECPECHHRWPK